MTLKEVGIVIGKKLVTSNCEYRKPPRVIVAFASTEIKGKSLLIGECGRGHTVGQAKADYCKKIKGQILITDAMLKTRKEIQMPPKITVR